MFPKSLIPYFSKHLGASIKKEHFFHILLHNSLHQFVNSCSKLVCLDGETLYAMVKQPFVKITEKTNLEHVKEFMEANGFVNKKNNDYFKLLPIGPIFYKVARLKGTKLKSYLKRPARRKLF